MLKPFISLTVLIGSSIFKIYYINLNYSVKLLLVNYIVIS